MCHSSDYKNMIKDILLKSECSLIEENKNFSIFGFETISFLPILPIRYFVSNVRSDSEVKEVVDQIKVWCIVEHGKYNFLLRYFWYMGVNLIFCSNRPLDLNVLKGYLTQVGNPSKHILITSVSIYNTSEGSFWYKGNWSFSGTAADPIKIIAREINVT